MPQVSTQEFERLPLRVHTFLAGVPLHDVWSVDLPRWRAGVISYGREETVSLIRVVVRNRRRYSRPRASCERCSTFGSSLDGSSVGITSQRPQRGKASQRV